MIYKSVLIHPVSRQACSYQDTPKLCTNRSQLPGPQSVPQCLQAPALAGPAFILHLTHSQTSAPAKLLKKKISFASLFLKKLTIATFWIGNTFTTKTRKAQTMCYSEKSPSCHGPSLQVLRSAPQKQPRGLRASRGKCTEPFSHIRALEYIRHVYKVLLPLLFPIIYLPALFLQLPFYKRENWDSKWQLFT